MPAPLDDLFSGDDARAEAALAHIAAEHLPALQTALRAGAADQRWWAVCALATLTHQPNSPAVAVLLSHTADPDADIRAAVFQALGEAHSTEAIVPLLFALSDPSAYLARLAADALIHIGAPAVPGLMRALEHDAEARVRINAARALAHIGDPTAIPALFHALEDDSPLVQHWADDGLERMGVGQVYFNV